MFRRTIRDQTLAVLNTGILFGNPLDPRVAFAFLPGAVDQIIVLPAAQGDKTSIDFRMNPGAGTKPVPFRLG